MLSGLTFKSLIHFEFIFIFLYIAWESRLVWVFCMELSSFPNVTYWRGCLFPTLYSYLLCCILTDRISLVYYWVLQPVVLVHVSIFVPVPYCLLIVSLKDSLKHELWYLELYFSLLKIVLAIWGLWDFHVNFRICLF